MNDLNKRIRQAQREILIEKLKENYWVVLILLSLIASYTAYSIPGDSRDVDGIVINATYPDAETEHVGMLVVRLDNNKQVDVEVLNKATHLKAGAYVTLQENTSFFLDVKSYRFIKAVD